MKDLLEHNHRRLVGKYKRQTSSENGKDENNDEDDTFETEDRGEQTSGNDIVLVDINPHRLSLIKRRLLSL